MRRIEIFGPPGVGKTTLRKRLVRSLRIRGTECWDQSNLPLLHLIECQTNSVLNEFVRMRLFPAAAMRWSTLDTVRRRFTSRVLTAIERDGTWRLTAEEWASGMSRSESPIGIRLVRGRMFSDCLAEARYIEESRFNGVGFLDEGLVQCGFSLAFSGVEDSVVQRYFEAMPMPALFIRLYAKEETISERLTHRDGARGRFSGILSRAKNIARLAESVVEKRGGVVLIVNSDEDLKRQINGLLKMGLIER